MTAYAASPSAPSPGRFLFPLLALLALAAGLALWGKIVLGDHATNRHGDEAAAIRKCLDEKGPYQAWIIKRGEEKTFYLLCQLPDERWGIQLVKWSNAMRKWLEISAFVPESGALIEVVNYLKATGATIFKQVLPFAP